jgi:hypothetical protein
MNLLSEAKRLKKGELEEAFGVASAHNERSQKLRQEHRVAR